MTNPQVLLFLSYLIILLTDNNYAYHFKIIGTTIIPILRSIQDRRSVLDNQLTILKPLLEIQPVIRQESN